MHQVALVSTREEGPRGKAEPCHGSKLALVLEYEGTQYAGFQLQPHQPTIQGELERALALLTGAATRVYAASRTDAGAHAWGQVVAFWTRAPHPPETFVQGLNFYLPTDIRVRAAYRVPDAFDPRRDATAREYHYQILQRRAPSALLRRHAYYIARPLDLEAMQEAARLLPGVRDFAPFSGNVEGRGTVRRLDRLEIKACGELVILEMEGNAFLPQQIRRMAGALVEVGTGKLTLEGFQALAESHRRGVAGLTLPARGLYLVRVRYPDFPP